MSATEGASEVGVRAGLGGRVVLALSDIKVAHSVFALPFAVLGSFMAAGAGVRTRRFAAQLALIVVCMVLARTWAMLVNRLADRGFDAANARTAGRALASGRVGVRDAAAVAGGAAAGFVVACGGFLVLFGNPWPLLLSVPVLGWIALYSFTKRFTALCHVFLGAALATSPLAAVVAVDPAMVWTTTGWAVVHLAGFVLLWVAGFDVAYALQDIDFDRGTGLHSIPARLGWRRAMLVSRAMHVVAFVSLTGAWWWHREGLGAFGVPMLTAIGGVGVLLIWEHRVIARRGVDGIPMAFFTINGIVSLVLGVTGCIDVMA